jgi:Cupin superfamily protein
VTDLLDIDLDRFSEAVGRTSMPVRHRLAAHDLLSVEALAVLADALPAVSVEHNVADVPVVSPTGEVQVVERSPGDIAREIASNGCWMVLKNVEQDPAYRALLDVCLDEVAPLFGGREGGMQKREAFVFLSSPNAVTPSHVDPEHNFLLQIRGVKHMNVGRFADPVVEQRELERVYGGGHRNIEQEPDDYTTFTLHPGDGVYVRPDAPHFVLNGPEPSVSLSITWRTPTTRRAARIHQVNGRLRALRLRPRPPGAPSDRVKAGVAVASAALRRVAPARG